MKITLILTCLSICCVTSLYAQNPGDQVFGKPHIFEVRFHFKQPGFLDSLHRSNQTGEYIPGNVTIDGVHYDSVGVRYKGHSSYLLYPGQKKPFRIKFDKYLDHRFDGMKKINLNNGWGDPTMLREKIHLDFLRDQGIPAPRADFARVFIDTLYWGFYSLVEHVDKVFLKTHFGDNDGNLYKAEKSTLEWKGSEQENYYQDLELKTNEKENDWSDLINFLDILNHTPDGDFPEHLETVLNPDSYLKVWAADNLFVNLDSYIGSAANYYLYDYPTTGLFEWIVWDVNLTLAARNGYADLDILYSIPQRPLLARLSAVETYKRQYLEIMENYVQHFFTSDKLFPKIDSLAAFIHQDYEADTLKMYSNEEILSAIDEETAGSPGLKPFILARRQNVIYQLDTLSSGITSLPAAAVRQPARNALHANYPNPFNPETLITFDLAEQTEVWLRIYNTVGQKVAILISGPLRAGTHQVTWNASGFPSGVYYYYLKTDDFQDVGKMVLLK